MLYPNGLRCTKEAVLKLKLTKEAVLKAEAVLEKSNIPSKEDGNHALIARASNAKERRHGHVKVLSRRVAPPSLVVHRAEVGGGHCGRACPKAPL